MAADDEPEQALSETLLSAPDVLSNIGRTVDGKGLAYRTLRLVHKHIGQIKAIEPYINLQHVDMSENLIKDVSPLKGLQYLLTLNLRKNAIAKLSGWEVEEGEVFPHMIELILDENSLTALSPLQQFKSLKKVSLARNEIATCQDFTGHGKIEVLDLSENRIGSLTGVGSMPELRTLNVSSNELTDINGLAELPELEDLNIAQNKMEALEGPWKDFPKISALNVCNNLLPDPKPLEALRNLPALRTLQASGNPFCGQEDADALASRINILLCHWRLTTIDGQAVTEEELEQAKQANLQRIEEEARKKAEEEAAAAAAAED